MIFWSFLINFLGMSWISGLYSTNTLGISRIFRLDFIILSRVSLIGPSTSLEFSRESINF